LTICDIELTAQKPLPKGYPVNPASFGDYIRQYRMAHCYSAFELSLELDVYESTIYKWEYGKTKPTPKNIQKIIEFMGYDPRIYNPLKIENYELT
jgi:transcriptional regulator with XRE-family HTH domain